MIVLWLKDNKIFKFSLHVKTTIAKMKKYYMLEVGSADLLKTLVILPGL